MKARTPDTNYCSTSSTARNPKARTFQASLPRDRSSAGESVAQEAASAKGHGSTRTTGHQRSLAYQGARASHRH